MKSAFLRRRLRLEIHIVPPDRRKRDISNLIKATEDSCPWFTDDSQIDELKLSGTRRTRPRKATSSSSWRH